MFTSIKRLAVTYDAINDHNAFKNGDIISGRIILEVLKETRIDSLSVKAKGKADVSWTETYGSATIVYHAKEKYFSMEEVVIQTGKTGSQACQALLTDNETYGNVAAPGIHEYKFMFQIPQGSMPSSFKGKHGKIIYSLEAKLNRSMRIPSKANTEFTFLSNDDMTTPLMMEPQYGSRDKRMNFMIYGNVSLNISTERMAYIQGEELKVLAEINNCASHAVTPKFVLYQKQSFFAKGKRRLAKKDVLKESGEPVPSAIQQTVMKVLTIPSDIPVSIINCPILKVEYRLKVYLEVPYAKDPYIKLPLIILSSHATGGPLTQSDLPKQFDKDWNTCPTKDTSSLYPSLKRDLS